MSSPLFRTQGLRKSFGGLQATDNVSIEVMPNEVHALIGPNGAGKSTLVNLISGVLKPDAGTIELDGQRLNGMSSNRRAREGLSRCFQVSSIFRQASVHDNLFLALQALHGRPLSFFKARATRDRELKDGALELAQAVGLQNSLHVMAGTLPHGAQRQLDVALALASKPKLLLLDEPMAGMGPDDSERMAKLIEQLRKTMAVLLIEHDMAAVFRLADRISVLVNGRVLVSGSTSFIRGNAEVRAVYLGEEDHE